MPDARNAVRTARIPVSPISPMVRYLSVRASFSNLRDDCSSLKEVSASCLRESFVSIATWGTGFMSTIKLSPTLAIEPRILEGFALPAQMSSRNPRSKKPGTLTQLVEDRSDVTQADLEKFFDKQSDLHSPIWLVIVGFLLGGGITGLIQLVRESSTIPSNLPTSLILAYLALFIMVLFLIPVAVGLLIVYILRYNPFAVQKMIIEDYLEAKAKLREKLKEKSNTTPTGVGEQRRNLLEKATTTTGTCSKRSRQVPRLPRSRDLLKERYHVP